MAGNPGAAYFPQKEVQKSHFNSSKPLTRRTLRVVVCRRIRRTLHGIDSRRYPVYDHLRGAPIKFGCSEHFSRAVPRYRNSIQNAYLPRPPQTSATHLKRLDQN